MSEVKNVKISELAEANTIYDGCCMPIVQNGETKKVYYSTIKQEILKEVSEGVAGDTLPIGSYIPWTKTTAPANWLLCDGSAISRTDYLELFNVIGTTFGAGDGSTTFNLPNLKGKVMVGLNEDDTDFNKIGKTGGEKTHTLTVDEMPNHNHLVHLASTTFVTGGTAYAAQYSDAGNINTYSVGGDEPHNNLQPYIVSTYIIKAKQSAGLVATVEDVLTSTSTTNALSANQGKVLNEKIKGTTLFESTAGDNSGSLSLNDTIANYDEVKVDFIVILSDYTLNDSKRVSIKDNRCISLTANLAHSDGLQLLEMARYLFSGATLSRQHETTSRIGTNGAVSFEETSERIRITKITGYSY